jgi:hypothetical protein
MGAFAQNPDSGVVTIYKDPRIDLLSKTQTKVNYGRYYGPRAAKGYRLMVLSTSDRALAMKVRSQLLQRFPDQKVYMTYQVPNIKLKFGNFTDKGDAEKYKNLISNGGIVKNNIYVVPETVEVKTSKNKNKTDE